VFAAIRGSRCAVADAVIDVFGAVIDEVLAAAAAARADRSARLPLL